MFNYMKVKHYSIKTIITQLGAVLPFSACGAIWSLEEQVYMIPHKAMFLTE